MPSTYSSSLRLELQATGENANTWGTKTNNNLNLIEQAVAGYVKITLTSASATYTLDIADASASDGRNAFIEFVGTVASAISVVVPDVEKGYWVKNSATGSNLTFRTSSGTGFTLPTNQWVFAITDGASAVNTTPTSLTGYARLASDQTFTGLNTFTSTVNVQAALSVTGNAFVSGVTTLASAVDIKGATSLASTLVVGGAATFNSNVSVSGTFLVSGAATLASSVDIKGATSLASTLLVNGNAVFNSNVSVSGTFTVSGVANLLSAVNLRGATSVGSTLVVNGAATFNSTVSVSSTLAVGPGAVGTPSISTTGDTNTGIWFPAADTLAASTGGSERMRIDSSGNVGIGTSSPAHKLDVNGNIALGSTIFSGTGVSTGDVAIELGGNRTGSGNSYIDFHSVASTDFDSRFIRNSGANGAFTLLNTGTGTFTLQQVANGAIAFQTNSAERMQIDASGNVGIGTSSPSQLLQLRYAGNTTLQISATNAGTNSATVTLENEGQRNWQMWADRSTDTLRIGHNTRASTVMAMDSTGNVRVGTAALATTATDGFLYIPTCAGTPTGTPTAITGLAPLVINSTNNKLYFYSGGAWRDAGP